MIVQVVHVLAGKKIVGGGQKVAQNLEALYMDVFSHGYVKHPWLLTLDTYEHQHF